MAGFMFSFSRCICLVFFGGGGYQEGSAVGSSLSWGGVLSLMAGVSPEAHPLGPVLVALWSPRSTSCQSTAGCWVQLSASGTCCTGLVHSRGILVYILPHFLLYFLSVFYYKSGPCYAQSIFEVSYTWWKNKWQIQCKHTMKAFLLWHLPVESIRVTWTIATAVCQSRRILWEFLNHHFPDPVVLSCQDLSCQDHARFLWLVHCH